MLDAPGKLGKVLVGMNRALGDIPLTVKLRTGMREKQNTAHKLMPRFGAEWGISAATVRYLIKTQQVVETDSLLSVVARKVASATLHPTCRLGIHQRMC